MTCVSAPPRPGRLPRVPRSAARRGASHGAYSAMSRRACLLTPRRPSRGARIAFQVAFPISTYTHSQTDVPAATRTQRLETRLKAPLRVAALVRSQVVPRWIGDLLLDL